MRFRAVFVVVCLKLLAQTGQAVPIPTDFSQGPGKYIGKLVLSRTLGDKRINVEEGTAFQISPLHILTTSHLAKHGPEGLTFELNAKRGAGTRYPVEIARIEFWGGGIDDNGQLKGTDWAILALENPIPSAVRKFLDFYEPPVPTGTVIRVTAYFKSLAGGDYPFTDTTLVEDPPDEAKVGNYDVSDDGELSYNFYTHHGTFGDMSSGGLVTAVMEPGGPEVIVGIQSGEGKVTNSQGEVVRVYPWVETVNESLKPAANILFARVVTFNLEMLDSLSERLKIADMTVRVGAETRGLEGLTNRAKELLVHWPKNDRNNDEKITKLLRFSSVKEQKWLNAVLQRFQTAMDEAIHSQTRGRELIANVDGLNYVEEKPTTSFARYYYNGSPALTPFLVRDEPPAFVKLKKEHDELMRAQKELRRRQMLAGEMPTIPGKPFDYAKAEKEFLQRQKAIGNSGSSRDPYNQQSLAEFRERLRAGGFDVPEPTTKAARGRARRGSDSVAEQKRLQNYADSVVNQHARERGLPTLDPLNMSKADQRAKIEAFRRAQGLR